MLTHIHYIISIAVLQHSSGNRCWIMFLVCEYTYHPRPFDKSAVKFLPGTSRQRDNLHVLVRQQQAVSQLLKGIERRVQLEFRIWHHTLNGICEAEEKWVARSEDHY